MPAPGKLDRCSLCQDAADPRMGVYDADGNAYPLCDGCAPNPEQADVDRVVALCAAAGAPPGEGRPRFWPKGSREVRRTCERTEEG